MVTLTFERDTAYTADSSKVTRELNRQDAVSAYYANYASHETNALSSDDKTASGSELVPRNAHSLRKTDENGNTTNTDSSNTDFYWTWRSKDNQEPEEYGSARLLADGKFDVQQGVVQNTSGPLGTGSIDVIGALLDFADKALWFNQAVGLTALDVLASTLWESTYFDAAKEKAWDRSGLGDTIVPALVEGGLTIAREVGIAYATGGSSLACGTGRLMATGMALVRTTLVAREAYQAYENTAAAYQDFKEGNYVSGLYHSTLAALNVAGVKSGLGRLKSDVHLAAFPNAHCFTAGTPIATEFGLRPIESVQENDRVWSFDLTTDQWELCRVAETYEREHGGDLVKIFLAGIAIESTYHHPYWVIEGEDLIDRPEPDHVRAATVRDAIVAGRWVDAGDLQIGDVLLLQDGRREPITEILLRHATCRVYNLAVEGLRNYAVGPCSVLAHNMCAAAANPTGVHAYEVGPANKLRSQSFGDGLDIHHVGQAHLYEQVVPNYSRYTGPAIAILEAEHALLPAIRGTTSLNARQILAGDIRNLRNFTNAPNSSLKQLIDLNRQMFPGVF